MGRIKRYRTAWSRHHRSGGFGIHSPFAFSFVQNVIGERYLYYSYAQIAKWRAMTRQANGRWQRPPVIKRHSAELLFRIANFFNPAHLLVVGGRDGVAAASVKLVSTKSTLFFYAPHFSPDKVQQDLLHSFGGKLRCFSGIGECLKSYAAQVANDKIPFVLIDEICDEMEYDALKSAVLPMACHKGVIIVRNLIGNALNARLWKDCCESAQRGQSYTNDKTGILIVNPKLQREHFTLWL